MALLRGEGGTIFVSPAGIEPTDDIAGVGDGVTDRDSFFARRLALRANGSDPARPLDPAFVNWASFREKHATWVADGANRFVLDDAFAALHAQGVEILVNLTASPSRFPLAVDGDWVNAWSPSISADEWLRRLRICSDALQAGLADANRRHGTSLGANLVALTEHQASQLYLYKFGQTERADGVYPVQKNGTHYVQNGTSGVNQYGGATKAAEVFRLFAKASGAARDRHTVLSTLGGEVWPMVTRDTTTGSTFAFVANRGTKAVAIELDLSEVGVPEGSPAAIEEVNGSTAGGVAALSKVTRGAVGGYTLPAQSVCLVTVAGRASDSRSVAASADAQLGDGASREAPSGAGTSLLVRSDGTVDGRRVALIRISVPDGIAARVEMAHLVLSVAAATGTGPAQVHVYGLEDDGWAEGDVTWARLSSALRQGVPAGSQIGSNVVAGQGSVTRVLGQLAASSTANSDRMVDVTGFVRAQTDGLASFLVVQDHRWDVALPTLAKGDVQAAGLRIDSREAGATGPRLLLESRAPSTDDFVTLTRSVPIVLDVASGFARFTTELALTNRGTRPVTARLLYQASIGDPAGSGETTEALGAGEQRVIPTSSRSSGRRAFRSRRGTRGDSSS